MIEYLNKFEKEKCYGCSACEQICAKKAIIMQPDSEGFSYPTLNKSLCINCGLCESICPYNSLIKENEIKECFALQNVNKEDLLDSSSGGAFILFAKWFLDNGGYVAGCVFDERLEAKHIISNRLEDIKKMQGSKYVQSNIIGIYSKIKELLDLQKKVLFTGTPCQVLGLISFLRKPYNNLLTIDLICHGVPSPKLLKNYIFYENKKGHNIKELKFRNKKLNGWNEKGSILYKKEKTISCYNNSFYNLFLNSLANRISCYTCKFAQKNRVGDVTIGDCWNIQRLFPDLNISLGYSSTIINSKKGQWFFNQIKSNASFFSIDYSFIEKNNPNLYMRSPMSNNRLTIYEYCEKFGYKKMARKFCHYKKTKEIIRKLTPKKIKNILRKIREK